MAEVALRGVSKRFGPATVIERLDLTIADKEFMVLVGPSGCGKSTALRLIAGLEEVSAGTISIGGRTVDDLAPKDRDVAMVFQSYALYPHMSVRENIEFGLRLRKTPKEEMGRRVDEAAQTLGLTELLDRRPKDLSGGQRQRVALGRAIVRQPAVFLFDEPLSNLDAKLRVQMRAEISRLQKRLATTTVYVTHDQVEAMTMGHRIAVLNAGRLQQVGTPLEIYDRPANLFVASFIGTPPMSFVPLPLPERLRRAAAGAGAGGDRRVVLGVRPEALREAAPGGPPAALSVRVEFVEPLGHEVVVHGRAGDDLLVAKVEPHRAPAMGDLLGLAVDVEALHLFDAATGERLATG
jgi:multiple sugar transport system ATP-binding protein